MEHFVDWTRRAPLLMREYGLELRPMMVAALTPNIRRTGMVAFIRTFAKRAHMQWLTSELSKNLANKKKILEADRKKALREYGVAFLLYTGQIKTWAHAKDSNLDLLDDSYELKSGKWAKPYYFKTKGNKSHSNSHVLALIYKPLLPTGAMATPGGGVAGKGVKQVGSGETPIFSAFLADNAQTAIDAALEEHFVERVCILGHQMFEVARSHLNSPVPTRHLQPPPPRLLRQGCHSLWQAGLTIQHFVKSPDPTNEPSLMYCASHLSLQTGDNSGLDTQLQMAGRTFFDLGKGVKAPTVEEWPIVTLGVKGLVDRLRKYEAIESELAEVGGKPMYEALRLSFAPRRANKGPKETDEPLRFSIDDLKNRNCSRIGHRRGNFASILGLTYAIQDAEKKESKKTKPKQPKQTSNPVASLSEAPLPVNLDATFIRPESTRNRVRPRPY